MLFHSFLSLCHCWPCCLVIFLSASLNLSLKLTLSFILSVAALQSLPGHLSCSGSCENDVCVSLSLHPVGTAFVCVCVHMQGLGGSGAC